MKVTIDGITYEGTEEEIRSIVENPPHRPPVQINYWDERGRSIPPPPRSRTTAAMIGRRQPLLEPPLFEFPPEPPTGGIMEPLPVGLDADGRWVWYAEPDGRCAVFPVGRWDAVPDGRWVLPPAGR